MAGFNGRNLTFDWDSTTLVGVKSKSFSITNEHVDVTTDDDNGWRTLLADPGKRSVDLTVSGVSSDEVLLAAIMNANVTGETLQIDLPSSLTTPGNLSGSYFVTSFEDSGSDDGAVEFSASFQSTGVVTYTASV